MRIAIHRTVMVFPECKPVTSINKVVYLSSTLNYSTIKRLDVSQILLWYSAQLGFHDYLFIHNYMRPFPASALRLTLIDFNTEFTLTLVLAIKAQSIMKCHRNKHSFVPCVFFKIGSKLSNFSAAPVLVAASHTHGGSLTAATSAKSVHTSNG